jgi:hypothetical protein
VYINAKNFVLLLKFMLVTVCVCVFKMSISLFINREVFKMSLTLTSLFINREMLKITFLSYFVVK